jgi:hypothetical protein
MGSQRCDPVAGLFFVGRSSALEVRAVAEQDSFPSSQAETASFPSLHRQAWNLARALADFVADGCTTVSRQEYEARLAVCDACDQRHGNRCLVCGCRLALKARGRAFQCPLAKWPPSQAEPSSDPDCD